MTDKEELRLTGTLSRERIESLIDKSDSLEALEGVDSHIEEAMVQYPTEDFLKQHRDQLRQLREKLRGNNRETMDSILESLDNLAQITFHASEYGMSELNEALSIIRATKR